MKYGVVDETEFSDFGSGCVDMDVVGAELEPCDEAEGEGG